MQVLRHPATQPAVNHPLKSLRNRLARPKLSRTLQNWENSNRSVLSSRHKKGLPASFPRNRTSISTLSSSAIHNAPPLPRASRNNIAFHSPILASFQDFARNGKKSSIRF